MCLLCSDNSARTSSGGFDNITVIPMHDILDVLDSDLKDRVRGCKLPEEKLKLEKAIGSGSFGMVYRGQLEKEKGYIVVAVKTLKGETCHGCLILCLLWHKFNFGNDKYCCAAEK